MIGVFQPFKKMTGNLFREETVFDIKNLKNNNDYVPSQQKSYFIQQSSDELSTNGAPRPTVSGDLTLPGKYKYVQNEKLNFLILTFCQLMIILTKITMDPQTPNE